LNLPNGKIWGKRSLENKPLQFLKERILIIIEEAKRPAKLEKTGLRKIFLHARIGRGKKLSSLPFQSSFFKLQDVFYPTFQKK
jgi:hypothetical protein